MADRSPTFGSMARRIEFRARQAGKTQQLIQRLGEQVHSLDTRNRELRDALEWVVDAHQRAEGGGTDDRRMAHSYARCVLSSAKEVDHG